MKSKQLETKKLSQKIQGNGQNDDEYIKENILDNEEVSAYTTRTNNRILNPTNFRPPSRIGTPESRIRSSPKASPEATSVNNGNINPLTGTSLTWEDPRNLTRGKDFPGYEDQTTTEDRKQRIRNSDPA